MYDDGRLTVHINNSVQRGVELYYSLLGADNGVTITSTYTSLYCTLHAAAAHCVSLYLCLLLHVQIN
jgi:hypothetical protein